MCDTNEVEACILSAGAEDVIFEREIDDEVWKCIVGRVSITAENSMLSVSWGTNAVLELLDSSPLSSFADRRHPAPMNTSKRSSSHMLSPPVRTRDVAVFGITPQQWSKGILR